MTTSGVIGALTAAVTVTGLIAVARSRGSRPRAGTNRNGPRPSDDRPTPVDARQDPDRAALERHRTTAEADLMTVSGGAPLCRIGEQPGAGSVKYVEGRCAALDEVVRSLRRLPDTTPRPTTEQVLAKWEGAQRAAGQQGPAWAAYHSGGIDELRSLVDDLDARGAR